MTDVLWHALVGNLVVSTGLAAIAACVPATGRTAPLAHLLWLLVLAKLVTPPLVTVPLVGLADAAIAPTGLVEPASPAAPLAFGASSSFDPWTVLLVLWALGSAVVLVRTLTLAVRFQRLLQATSHPAPRSLRRAFARLARRMGVARAPELRTTTARIAPMVWWTGRAVRVVLPDALVEPMPTGRLEQILAHELAHVRRRDHLVRWLEWLTCVGFWWNPIVWWARRSLRVHEEIACDALVLATLRCEPRSYASSLLDAVELLAAPVLRPPAMASPIDGGGALRRRLEMVLSHTSVPAAPRWLRAAALIPALGLLSVGVAHAQRPDVPAVGARLEAAVDAGELSAEQAKKMMAALKKAAAADVDAVGRRLRAAVAAGELSAEHAKAMMGVLQQDPAAGRKDAVSWSDVREKLGGAVEAGKLMREEAAQKLDALRREAAERTGAADRKETVYWSEVREKLRAAVEAGELSREEAARKVEAVLREAAEKAGTVRDPRVKGSTTEDAERLRREIRAALDSGRITPEQARAKLAGVWRSAAEPAAPKDVPAERVRARLKQAVESGSMSADDARRRFEAWLREQSDAAAPTPKVDPREGGVGRE